MNLIKRLLTWLFSIKVQSPIPAPISQPEPPQPQPEPIVEPVKDKLTQFALCIRDYEGSPPNDRNYRNNNAGNCKYSPVGYLPIYQPVKKDKDGFAIFKDYETGFLYLKNLIKEKASKNPNQTLFQFMANTYAPKEDDNNPVAYTNYIAHRLGVSVDTPMKLLV